MVKILVIDDDRGCLEVIERILNIADYESILATDGISGLLAYATHLPDLVLVDIVLPGKNGLEVISEIRQQSPRQRIIALTAYELELELARKSNVNDVLPKPFGAYELLDRVQACLDHSVLNLNAQHSV